MAFKKPENREKYHSPWGDVSGEDPTPSMKGEGQGKINPRAMGTVSFSDSPNRIDMRKIIFGIGILVIIIGTMAFWFFSRVGRPSVGLEFMSPSEVAVGEAFQMKVGFSNFSGSVLKNVRLVLSLPDGAFFVGSNSDHRAEELAIGDLGPGSIPAPKTFDLVIVEGSQSIKKFEAKLIYSVAPNDKIVFESDAETDVRVGQPAVNLEMKTPKSVFSGENFEITVKYKNNTKNNFENFALQLSYPSIFQFENASEKPSRDDNYWEIGILEPNSETEFIIKGSVIGQEGSVANFAAELSTEVQGKRYAVNKQAANVEVSVAPLSLAFKVNNSSAYAAKLSDSLKYTISYKNSSDFALQNVKVSAHFVGELFDFSTVRSDATFNSFTNTFTWTAAEDSRLASLDPGGGGDLSLTIRLKDAFLINKLGDKNFVLRVDGQIESPTVPPGVDALKTVSVGTTETKVAGNIEVDVLAFYRDAVSGILNSGPFPPRVDQPTEYTIHWKLKNYATDVSNVVVSAYLQSGSQFTGKTKSTIGEAPVYDQGSGKVIWSITNLSATRGVVGSQVEAVFQVVLAPNSNQVGKFVDILSKTDVEAKDDFTGVVLTNSDSKLTTELPDDPTVSTNSKVLP